MNPSRVAELVDVEAVQARLQVAHVAAYLDGAGSLCRMYKTSTYNLHFLHKCHICIWGVTKVKIQHQINQMTSHKYLEVHYPDNYQIDKSSLSGLMMSMLMTIISNSTFSEKKVACSTMLKYD